MHRKLFWQLLCSEALWPQYQERSMNWLEFYSTKLYKKNDERSINEVCELKKLESDCFEWSNLLEASQKQLHSLCLSNRAISHPNNPNTRCSLDMKPHTMNRRPHTYFEIDETIQMLHVADSNRYHEIHCFEVLCNTCQWNQCLKKKKTFFEKHLINRN